MEIIRFRFNTKSQNVKSKSMKTIILLMFPILAVSNTLSAQTKFNRFQFKDMNSDNTFSYSQHVICPIEKFKLNEMADLFADKKN